MWSSQPHATPFLSLNAILLITLLTSLQQPVAQSFIIAPQVTTYVPSLPIVKVAAHREHQNAKSTLAQWSKTTSVEEDDCDRVITSQGQQQQRRDFLESMMVTSLTTMSVSLFPYDAFGDDNTVTAMEEVQVMLSGETKQLFNEARYLESQGNVPAAQRIYLKVTKIAPRYIYGWSNLGNTQVALGSLPSAEQSYTNAINLCQENIQTTESKFGVRRCDDLYILLLNRGALRLNNNAPQEALADLNRAAELRGKPDAIILQNRARARELNSLYGGADRDYSTAISMTSNEVAPFWLRSAMVKFQIGDLIGALDLARRVEVRFGEAPEVRAAIAALLMAKGDEIGARRKYLEIPDRARKNFVDQNYLKNTIAWPPAMIDSLAAVSKAAGD